MSTYTYLSDEAAAVGVSLTTITITGIAETIIGTALTVTNILTAKVLATVAVYDTTANFNRAYQIPVNPGEAIYPMRGESWVLPAGYQLKVGSDTASSLDVVFNYAKVT